MTRRSGGRPWGHQVRLGLVLLVSIGILACQSCSDDDLLAREVRQLQEWTTPSGARTVEVSAISRDRQTQSAETVWRIDAAMNWASYRDWVVGRAPSYRLERDEGDALVLSRQAEGDIYRLTLKGQALGEKEDLRVQASFRATAF